MTNYKIAFIGIGSIGKRHIRNVFTYINSIHNSCEIDIYRSGHGEELPIDIKSIINETYSYSEEVKVNYDMVFVTNPTISHYDAIKKFSKHTKSFFIEKPVFDKTNIDTSILKDLKDVLCYVACPLRQHPIISYIKHHVNLNEVFSARAISSSYLPDWRPGQDYRKCFCSHRDMGGGVGIDLIHEWDYLIHLFGMPIIHYNIHNKISNLEIDSDDIAIYIARTPKTTIEIHLDYFGRETIRTLDLFMKEDTIHCDLISGAITRYKTGEHIQMNIIRDDYQIAEIKHFFNIYNKIETNDNPITHALEVLKIAEG